MTILKLAACGASLVALAACGGSSTGSAPQTFSEQLSEGDALAITLASIEYTDPTTLPVSGSATYSGYLGVDAGELGQAIGQMSLTASFASDSISGNVRNVVAEDEEQLSGSLSISGGTIDRTADTDIEFTFAADVDGTLTGEDGDFVVDAELLGDFTGENHQYVEGPVGGTVTFDGQDFNINDGGFVAER